MSTRHCVLPGGPRVPCTNPQLTLTTVPRPEMSQEPRTVQEGIANTPSFVALYIGPPLHTEPLLPGDGSGLVRRIPPRAMSAISNFRDRFRRTKRRGSTSSSHRSDGPEQESYGPPSRPSTGRSNSDFSGRPDSPGSHQPSRPPTMTPGNPHISPTTRQGVADTIGSAETGSYAQLPAPRTQRTSPFHPAGTPAPDTPAASPPPTPVTPPTHAASGPLTPLTSIGAADSQPASPTGAARWPAISQAYMAATSAPRGNLTARAAGSPETPSPNTGKLSSMAPCGITDLRSYLGHIAEERLHRMPPRGSDWDRIFQAAQFFGLQLWTLGLMARSPRSATAASVRALTATHTLLLLNLQSQTLLPTFQVFYQLGAMISQIGQIDEKSQMEDAVSSLHSAVVKLVDSVSCGYRDKLFALDEEDPVIKFETAFEDIMNSIFELQHQVITRMWLSELRDQADIQSLESIRRQLRPNWSEKNAFYDQVNESLTRAGETCEWFESHLVRFLSGRGRAFAITGGSGTGKTVLAGWIRERLRRALGHQEYLALTYAFPFDSPTECTPLSLLRSLLFELFERRIGGLDLYKSLASAFKDHDPHRSSARELETFLWMALKSALESPDLDKANVVIILDGVDRIEAADGGSPSSHATLVERISQFSTCRIITLSRTAPPTRDGDGYLAIPPRKVRADIETYFRHSLPQLPCFAQLGDVDRRAVIQELAAKHDISFMWANLMVRLLCKTASPEDFRTALHNIGGSLDDTIQELISKRSLQEAATRELLSFMLVAFRPPMVAEAAELLGVDVDNVCYRVSLNVPEHIKQDCDDIVVIERGALHFRSEAIRRRTQTLMGIGKSQPSEQEAHRRLTLVLLLYAKLTLKQEDSPNPSFEPLDGQTIDRLSSAYPLLHYAASRWQVHLHHSGLNPQAETSKLRDVFPRSHRFVLVQRSIWREESSAPELVRRLTFFRDVRRACFGEEPLFKLQVLVMLANICIAHPDEVPDGDEHLYRAACTGEDYLPRFSTVTAKCAESYLQRTETAKITARDEEIFKRRERMIRLLIKISQMTSGFSSHFAVHWRAALVNLFIDVGHFEEATKIYKEIYDEGIDDMWDRVRRRVYDHLGALHIKFGADTPAVTNPGYIDFIIGFESAGTDDKQSVNFLLRIAYAHETRCEWLQAEDSYELLWRRVREDFLGEPMPPIELQRDKLRVGIQYAKFLQNRGFVDEASDKLTYIWNEHERYDMREGEILGLFRDIGLLLNVLGRGEAAASVLIGIFGKYKEIGVTPDRTLIDVLAKLLETVTTTGDLRLIFGSRPDDEIDEVFFATCLMLANRHMKLENWNDAEEVLKTSLEASWGAFLTAEETVEPPEHFAARCIQVAVRLANCHDRQDRRETAEKEYLRAFHCCLLAAAHIQNEEVRSLLDALARFCQGCHYYESVFKLYLKIFDEFRKRLGRSDALVIRIWYDLASYSKRFRRGDGHKYYIEIDKALNADRDHCHPDAFKAAVELVEYYRAKEQWAELQHTCTILWCTFIHHREGITFAEDDILLIYEVYVEVLESHPGAGLPSRYQISLEFYEAAKTVFDPDAPVVITAMAALAFACEEAERYRDAIDIYKDLIEKTPDTDSTRTTVTATKKRVIDLFISRSLTGIETPMIEWVIGLCREIYARLRTDLGCWHLETLSMLRATVSLYRNPGINKSRAETVDLLCNAFRDIVTADCDSTSLYDAAEILAIIFKEADLADLGRDLVFQARHLSVFGDNSENRGEVVLDLGASPNEKCFVFLVSFEQRVGGAVAVDYSDLITAYRLEKTLYGRYRTVAESDVEANVEQVLDCGARLLAFWHRQDQKSMSAALQRKLFHFFKKKYSAIDETSDDSAHAFFLALLATLMEGDRHSTIDFGTLVCRAGNTLVRELIGRKEFDQALGVASYAFRFANQCGYYNDRHRIRYAYGLAGLMAGLDVAKPEGALEKEYQTLSKEIADKTLSILKDLDIDLVRLNPEARDAIIRLLGHQGNYEKLENLLSKLWDYARMQNPRRVRFILDVGRLMVYAHAAREDKQAAIQLCETIRYNLYHSRGILDPETVGVSEILSGLHVLIGEFDDAAMIHEHILAEVKVVARGGQTVAHDHWGSNSYPGHGSDSAHKPKTQYLIETANRQLELLAYSYTRQHHPKEPPLQQLDEQFSELRRYLGHDVRLDLQRRSGKDGKMAEDYKTGPHVDLVNFEWRLGSDELMPDADYIHAAHHIWSLDWVR
ncbi:hypothetical protein DL765_004521 [Monosporascus sp. GIB2]|nr:hypothetical protein DL765_004521 [Monosporascus sp. GIB2]